MRSYTNEQTAPVANESVESLIRKADAEYQGGRELEAAEILERALLIEPGFLQAKFKLATIRVNRPRRVDDLEFAFRIARELLDLHPRHPDASMLAAVAGYYLGAEDAQQHLEWVVEILPEGNPDYLAAHYSQAVQRLGNGDFSAFPDWDYLFNRMPSRSQRLKLRTPRWDGGHLGGRRVLLHGTLDGHGDAFQFARYIPMVVAEGGPVTFVCHPSQARMFLHSAEHLKFDRIIAQGARVPPGALDHDVQAALQSLPAIFRTALDSVPAEIPYLAPDAASVERWRPVIEAIPGFRVGIVWRGNPQHTQDGLRSFDLNNLAPLAAIPGVTLVNLQKDHGADQLAGAAFPVVDLGPDYAAGDWLDTAAIVSQLDLVVTPDTAVAHLAGALGRPVWIALASPAEWRWMRDREDSPWYPTMRLFRQDRLGDWGPVFRRMAEALSNRVGRAE